MRILTVIKQVPDSNASIKVNSEGSGIETSGLKQVCDHRRPPVYVELEVDGMTVFAESLPPRGLAGSGPSQVYERFALPAGAHDIAVRLRDRPATEGFDYAAERRVTLAPAESFVIDFRPEAGGFVFQ